MKAIWHFYNACKDDVATIHAKQSTSDPSCRWVSIGDASAEAVIWLSEAEARALIAELQATVPEKVEAF